MRLNKIEAACSPNAPGRMSTGVKGGFECAASCTLSNPVKAKSRPACIPRSPNADIAPKATTSLYQTATSFVSVRCSVRGTKHDAGSTLLPHGLQDLFLLINVFIRVRHQHDVPGLDEFPLDADEDLSEERIGKIVDDDANGLGRATTQLAGPAVVDVSELAGSRPDPVGGFRRNQWTALQHERNSGLGKICLCGDVKDRDGVSRIWISHDGLSSPRTLRKMLHSRWRAYSAAKG